MADINWSDAKTRYVTTNLSYRQIAEEFGVSHSQMRQVGAREKWTEARNSFRIKAEQKTLNKAANVEAKRYDRLVSVSNKALARIEQMIEKCNDAQGMRALIASLRDIKGIQGARSDAETREQEARIDKLKKDAESDQKDNNININITGLPAELDETKE